MNKYVIVVHGEFCADPETGFYTGRFIKANSAEEAENIALDMVENDPGTDVLNGRKPLLSIETMRKIGFWEWIRKRGNGAYIYYGAEVAALWEEEMELE